MKKLFLAVLGLTLLFVFNSAYASAAPSAVQPSDYYCQNGIFTGMVLHFNKANKTFNVYQTYWFSRACMGTPRAYQIVGSEFSGTHGTKGHITSDHAAIFVEAPSNWSGVYSACNESADPCLG